MLSIRTNSFIFHYQSILSLHMHACNSWRMFPQIETHYAILQFTLAIKDLCAEEEGGTEDAYAGKFNLLKMVKHESIALSRDAVSRVLYDLPSYANFKFYRQWHWNGNSDSYGSGSVDNAS